MVPPAVSRGPDDYSGNGDENRQEDGGVANADDRYEILHVAVCAAAGYASSEDAAMVVEVHDAAVADSAMVGLRSCASCCKKRGAAIRVWATPPNEAAHTIRAAAIDDVAHAVECLAPVAEPALHLLGYGEAGRLCPRHHSWVAK
eukprot:CAMPEP_0119061800 /NCGR_PEP_ID=MMETSP1178-20130426/5541_1 /TAXON_ID=33656 /ORGANISM="unid sp, Strain CCMP2000" /LENGTH=144 /DNA_ID=CAMNT_0007043037 /DNA_START=91 /DNA_END=525 /DNA_ORIENTATION=+